MREHNMFNFLCMRSHISKWAMHLSFIISRFVLYCEPPNQSLSYNWAVVSTSMDASRTRVTCNLAYS
ncbi:hypothetical protein Fmac_024284 [Flemingia macrophylla]|uniref:Uncharacterized protein n=1 Tax=Flemingia macrophylla TaxID=520843 RepID=A0ABD1LNY5_9FABA